MRQRKRTSFKSMTATPIARKTQQAAFILLACMSLVISSFGACICPHHETEIEKLTLSCHSTSHEAEFAESVSGANKAETPCICVRDYSPVILNKAERKKSIEQKDQVASIAIPSVDPVDEVATAVPLITDTGPNLYKLLHSKSAPSRAPPRL